MRTRASLWTSVSVIAGALAFASSSWAAVMNFEDVVSDNGSRIPGAYHFEQGFNITSMGPGADLNGIFGKDYAGLNSDGSAVFGWCNETHLGCQPVIRLNHWGAYFDLVSLDGSTLVQLSSAIPSGLALVIDGGRPGMMVSQTLPLVQGSWQSFPLAGFQGLTWVHITTNMQGVGAEGDVAIDNIVLRYVPEPGTLALVIGGMGLAAFRGRRSR